MIPMWLPIEISLLTEWTIFFIQFIIIQFALIPGKSLFHKQCGVVKLYKQILELKKITHNGYSLLSIFVFQLAASAF